jgi:hypothetical protein
MHAFYSPLGGMEGNTLEFYHAEIELRKKKASYSTEQDVCRHCKEKKPCTKQESPAETCITRIEV